VLGAADQAQLAQAQQQDDGEQQHADRDPGEQRARLTAAAASPASATTSPLATARAIRRRASGSSWRPDSRSDSEWLMLA
jgi:hypothetical protein